MSLFSVNAGPAFSILHPHLTLLLGLLCPEATDHHPQVSLFLPVPISQSKSPSHYPLSRDSLNIPCPLPPGAHLGAHRPSKLSASSGVTFRGHSHHLTVRIHFPTFPSTWHWPLSEAPSPFLESLNLLLNGHIFLFCIQALSSPFYEDTCGCI